MFLKCDCFIDYSDMDVVRNKLIKTSIFKVSCLMSVSSPFDQQYSSFIKHLNQNVNKPFF